MIGSCPFGHKCSDCVLFRKGMRMFDDGRKPEAFEECALVLAVDCLEALVARSIGQQKAIEQTRNGVTTLHTFFEDMANAKRLRE